MGIGLVYGPFVLIGLKVEVKGRRTQPSVFWSPSISCLLPHSWVLFTAFSMSILPLFLGPVLPALRPHLPSICLLALLLLTSEHRVCAHHLPHFPEVPVSPLKAENKPWFTRFLLHSQNRAQCVEITLFADWKLRQMLGSHPDCMILGMP